MGVPQRQMFKLRQRSFVNKHALCEGKGKEYRTSATRLWEFSQFWEFQLLCWDKIQICWEFPKPVKVWEFETQVIDLAFFAFCCHVSYRFNQFQTYAIAKPKQVHQLVANILPICLFCIFKHSYGSHLDKNLRWCFYLSV